MLALPKLELLKINGGNGLTELLPSLIEARGSQTRYLNLRGKCIGTLAPKELQTVNNALLSCSHLEELDLFGNALGNR